MESSDPEAIGCVVASVAGRVGSSYAARLSGPESVSGTVEHNGDGVFSAEYIGPIAGAYELEVRLGFGVRLGPAYPPPANFFARVSGTSSRLS